MADVQKIATREAYGKALVELGKEHDDLLVFDDVDGDVVIDETEDVQVEVFDRAFYFDDVLDTHLVALCIFDDGNGAVKFVEFQVMIDCHGFAGLDMVKYKTFVKCSNV